MSLDWAIQFCVFSTAANYIVSIITGNVAQVDRVWTFLPTIYTAYYALLPLFPTYQPFLLFPYNPLGSTDYNPRALLMFALVFLWMYRLSYNTYRRGLFNPYVRSFIHLYHESDVRSLVNQERRRLSLGSSSQATTALVIPNLQSHVHLRHSEHFAFALGTSYPHSSTLPAMFIT